MTTTSEPAASLEVALVDRPHTLYRMYDAVDRLLYVGITVDIPARFTTHKAEKPWWTEVATIKLEHHQDRVSALAAERAAIAEEDPVHNARRSVAGRAPAQTGGIQYEGDDCVFQALSEIEGTRYDLMNTLCGCQDDEHRAWVAKEAAAMLRALLEDVERLQIAGARPDAPVHPDNLPPHWPAASRLELRAE